MNYNIYESQKTHLVIKILFSIFLTIFKLNEQGVIIFLENFVSMDWSLMDFY